MEALELQLLLQLQNLRELNIFKVWTLKVMSNFMLVTAVFFLWEVTAFAEELSRFEIFGGYARRFDGLQYIEDLNGWQTSVSGNLNHWLGLVADVNGTYGSYNSSKEHSLMFGPQLTLRKHERLTPFFHSLFGGINRRETFQTVAPRPGGGPPIPTGTVTTSTTEFTITLGGGLDLRGTDRVAVRLVEIDYLTNRRDQVFNRWGDNWKLSMGIVFHFGKN